MTTYINGTKINKGNTYILYDNNVSIGTYTYVGMKSGLNSKEKMAVFLMFQKKEPTSNYDMIEGYEFDGYGLVEPAITIRCTDEKTFSMGTL